MARAGLDWSAYELAVAARVGRNTIARIEAGCTVRAETAERVLRALAEAGVRFDPAPRSTVTVSVVVDEHYPTPDGRTS
jgi:predicted transcriptional regulator